MPEKWPLIWGTNKRRRRQARNDCPSRQILDKSFHPGLLVSKQRSIYRFFESRKWFVFRQPIISIWFHLKQKKRRNKTRTKRLVKRLLMTSAPWNAVVKSWLFKKKNVFIFTFLLTFFSLKPRRIGLYKVGTIKTKRNCLKTNLKKSSVGPVMDNIIALV